MANPGTVAYELQENEADEQLSGWLECYLTGSMFNGLVFDKSQNEAMIIVRFEGLHHAQAFKLVMNSG